MVSTSEPIARPTAARGHRSAATRCAARGSPARSRSARRLCAWRCQRARRRPAAPASERPREPRRPPSLCRRRVPRAQPRARPGPRHIPSLLGSDSSASRALATLLERVGDVLQEQQPEDEVLVLRGLDRAAQLVRSLEQRGAVRAVVVGGPGGHAGTVSGGPLIPLKRPAEAAAVTRSRACSWSRISNVRGVSQTASEQPRAAQTSPPSPSRLWRVQAPVPGWPGS